MALRDFFSSSEIVFQPSVEGLAAVERLPETLYRDSRHQQQSPVCDDCVQEEVEPVLPAVQSLAQDMEQSRLKLLELLLECPLALDLLTDQLTQPFSQGVEFSQASADRVMYRNVVQESCFVQVDSPLYSGLTGQQQSPNDIFSPKSYIRANLGRIHFFPVLLIRIADRVQQQNNETSSDKSAYLLKLAQSRNRLQNLRQQMINGNTGLVAFVACKQKTASLSFEDLMQEGVIGLIRAVDRFDPNRGIRFSTYAIFWIKQAISRLIIKQEKVVRLPVALAEKAAQVFEAMRSCYLENNRWPSLPELQAQCSLSPEDIKTVSCYYQATHSLDASLSEDNDAPSMLDTLRQQQFALPLNELIDANLSLYIGNVVSSLSEKEATILNMRFGLKNNAEMTLQAIADQLHVTRERVRQIQNQALKKLKQQFGFDLAPFLEANDI